MSRSLASVVTISKVSPIEGADRLEVAEMNGKGWRVVVSKGDFKAGDMGVYFEIDSALNPEDTRYAFLKERCLRTFKTTEGVTLKSVIRIKTIKLRGVLSQGLLIRADMFPEADGLVVGADLTKTLGVEHYDEIEESLRPQTGNAVCADAMGKFPTDYIPKTDEERIQNLSDFFAKMKGRRFEVTEKNDGTSVTMFYSYLVDSDNPFGVCSRNLRLKPCSASGETPTAWRMAEKYDVRRKLAEVFDKSGGTYALQGELVGPSVNCNRDKYTDWEWHVFRVYDIQYGKFMLPREARMFCEEMGIPYVHVVAEDMDVFSELTDTDAVLAFAEGKTIRGNEREGLVFKSVDEPFVSFKAVSNRYLLKQS